MMYFKFKKSGFSLVEVLVAVSILLLVMAGPMRIVSRANNATAYSSETVTAFFLAQEGLELVQRDRDSFVLENFEERFYGVGSVDSWGEFLTKYDNCVGDKCGVYWDDDANPAVAIKVIDCTTETNCKLYLNSVVTERARYTHDGGGNGSTPFTRTIRIDESTGVDEVKVTSTVTWRTGSLIAGQKVELVTYLSNVYEDI